MSDTSQRQRPDFSSLWPFAGNAFLVLFAAWLAYMGWAAQVPDVKTAFFGLAVVAGLLLLFGLRAAASPQRQRVAPIGGDAFARYGDDDADGLSEWADEAEGDDPGAMPVNARMRERRTAVIERAPSAHGDRSGSGMLERFRGAAVAERRHDSPGGGGQSGGPDEKDPGGPERPAKDAVAAIESIRADMARDKALRGARMTRVENAVEALTARVDGLARQLGGMGDAASGEAAGRKEGGAVPQADVVALLERIERLEQRSAPAGEQAGGEIEAMRERLAALEASLAAMRAAPARSDGETGGGADERFAAIEEKIEGLERAGPAMVAGRLDRLERQIAEAGAPTGGGSVEALEERLRAVEGAAEGSAERARVDGIEGRLAAIEAALPGGAADGADASALASRVAALEEELRARPSAPGGDVAELLKNYVSISTFNQAMNQKVVPQIRQIVERRVEELLTAEALRERIAPLLPAAQGEREPVADGELETLRTALATERAARARLGDELAAVRAVAEKAASSPAPAEAADSDALDRLAAARAADRREIEALREAVDALGGATHDGLGRDVAELARRLDAIEERSTGRLDEATRAIAQVRENLSAITQHVARMGENYQQLVRRVERLGEAQQVQRPAGPAVQADVEALRDALTTIIEQNREIRQHQELLTARFDRPTRVELDTDGDGNR